MHLKIRTSSRRAGSALVLALAALAPTAAFAQTADNGDFGGVLYIWGAILVFGGIAAGVASFIVAGQMRNK
jgi:hypothetical protein